MRRREFLAGALLAGAPARGAARRPNVLFIAVDDLRPQLGCYGDRFARTPHMDSIAARGIVFRRAYCQQAVCGPSRASLLTGLRPDTIRVYDLSTPFRDAVPDAVTLPHLFKQNGYVTENIGKVFHGSEVMQDHRAWSAPERLHMVTKRDQYALAENKGGKDEWDKTSSVECADVPDEAYIDGRVAADAASTIARLKDRPFFLGVGFVKPHLPFAAPKKYWDMFDRNELPLAGNPRRPAGAPPYAITAYSELRSYADVPDTGPIPEAKMREAIHGYYAATAYTDANVGKVLAALRRHKLEANTIIVVWGDHGWHLGEHDYWGKTTNFEICTRSPLILSAPGRKNAGAAANALVEFVDIYPTLAGLCGLRPPANLEGASFVPLLDNPARPWKSAAFSQYPRAAKDTGGEPLMGYSMRTDRYRYTEWQRKDGTAAAAELYDHETDPMETTNTSARPENKTLVAQLAAKLRAGWKAALPPLAALLLAAGLAAPADAQPREARLLAADDLLAAPASLTLVPGRTSTVYRAEKGGWQFNLHSYLAFHDGKFWAVWSSGRVDEDSGNQMIRYSTSTDGHAWAPSQVLAGDPDGPDKPGLWIARGVYTENGKLYALAAYNEGPGETPQGRESWRNLRLVRFEWAGGRWVNRGTYVENCMNNYPPRRLGDGLVMTCRDSFMRMHTAYSDPSGTKWTVVKLPGEAPHDRMSEPSWYVDAMGAAHMIFRDGRRSGYLYRSISRDRGRTWSAPVRTNYPDATSKNIAGRLSTGRYFLINNPDQKGRDPLAVAFSLDGWTFSAPRALRKDAPPQRYPGRSKNQKSFQYPHAIERHGSLWVIYSTNKEDIEISEYKLADLESPREASRLLEDPVVAAAPKSLAQIPGRTSTVYRAREGHYQFNLHSYLARYDGKFWAIWSSGLVHEDTNGQAIRYATSVDGHTWSEAGIVAPDPDGLEGPAFWIARGVFVAGGKLTALAAYIKERGNRTWPGLRLMRFEWDGSQWREAGLFADDCMSNYPPQQFGAGWFMTCRDSARAMYTALSPDLANGSWRRQPLPLASPGQNMSEPSSYADPGGVVHLIFRDQGRSGFLHRSLSYDNGGSWTAPVRTNYPDATSKNFTGLLSNGQYYLINNPDQKSRDPLAIAFSGDGWTFGRAMAVRREPPARRYAGGAKGSGSVQYPHAIEHGGSLWVIYATNKEDIDVTEIKLSDVPRDPARLLSDAATLVSDPLALKVAKGETATVFRGVENVSGFNLHSYIAHHAGRFWVMWSSSKVGEEDPDQHLRYATSADGMRWSESRVLAPDPDGPGGPARWIARGLYVEQGRLYALGAYIESADYGNRGRDEVWKNLRLMRFEWTGGGWEERGLFAENCMNNFPPARLGGFYGMPCRDSRMDVFMALADAPGPGAWSRTPLAAEPPFHKMDEPTLYAAPDGSVHMIVRDNNRSGRLIRAVSKDGGRTWARPVLTDYPDAASKNFTGRLSAGRYYLINNPNPGGRDPLAISFSKDGWVYSGALAVRKGAPPLRFAGRAKGSGTFQYPHAIEHDGSLWVVYATNKEDIEVTRLRLSDLGL